MASSAPPVLFVTLLTSPYYLTQEMDHWRSRCKFLYDSTTADSVVVIPSHLNLSSLLMKGRLGHNSWYPMPDCRQLVQRVDVVASRWSQTHPSATAFCSGRSWTSDYAMYSGAFFAYHLLRLSLLRRYRFYVKVDSDICVHKRIPVHWLLPNDPDVLVMHTQIHASTDCERGALERVRDYRSKHGAMGPMSPWCEYSEVREIVYGNFVVFNVTFMTSERVLRLTDYLYHERGEGYFKYRWSDQALIPSLLCGAAEPRAVRNMNLDPRLQSLAHLRGTHFEHRKRCS